MQLTQLIYASRPFGYDDLTLQEILQQARANNGRDEITGSLICREDMYLQLLEGQGESVAAAYERIRRDARHVEVAELVRERVSARLFPDWEMRHDPARSWMWTRGEIAAGGLRLASKDDIRNVFVRLAAGAD